MRAPSETPLADRLPKSEKLAYALGTVPFGIAYSALAQLIYPVFNLTLGMSATLIGVVLAIGRLWDAVTDPVMGTFSDNARTKWGRRRPFILLGGLALGVCFPLIWMAPAGWSEGATMAWLVVTVLMFYTASTLYSVPWLSLGYEITPDPVERTRVQAWRAYVNIFTMLSLPWVFRLAQADFFPDTATGMRWLGGLLGLCMAAFAIPVFLGTKERALKRTSHQQKIRLRDALRETFRNRPFLIFVIGVVTTMLCAPILVGSLGLYINSYHVFPGDTKRGAEMIAYAGMIGAVIKLFVLPFCVKLVKRFGKLPLMQVALWLGLVGSLSKWFLYTPEAPWLQFVSLLLLAPSVTAFWLLVDPVKADCADYDESRTGLRREGMYAAVANWIEKLSIAAVLVFSGLALDWSGFDAKLGAVQPEGTMTTLRALFALVPAAGFVIALLALRAFPLTDERMVEIRATLAARRAAADTAPAVAPVA